MKLNELVYAIVDKDGTVLGDGECAAISTSMPDDDELKWVVGYCNVPGRIQLCKLVPIASPTPATEQDALHYALPDSPDTICSVEKLAGNWTDKPKLVTCTDCVAAMSAPADPTATEQSCTCTPGRPATHVTREMAIDAGDRSMEGTIYESETDPEVDPMCPVHGLAPTAPPITSERIAETIPSRHVLNTIIARSMNASNHLYDEGLTSLACDLRDDLRRLESALTSAWAERDKMRKAMAYPCYGYFRTRPDENDGKEFFMSALWHNQTRREPGDRWVKGWFIEAAALAADPAESQQQGGRWVK